MDEQRGMRNRKFERDLSIMKRRRKRRRLSVRGGKDDNKRIRGLFAQRKIYWRKGGRRVRMGKEMMMMMSRNMNQIVNNSKRMMMKVMKEEKKKKNEKPEEKRTNNNKGKLIKRRKKNLMPVLSANTSCWFHFSALESTKRCRFNLFNLRTFAFNAAF